MASLSDILGIWATGEGPLYRQLGDAIAGAIERGDLDPGEPLPAQRTLAAGLAISRTTLVAALDDLKRRGWLESRRGSGTWISVGPGGRDAEPHAVELTRRGAMRPFVRSRPGSIDLTFDAPPPLEIVGDAVRGLAHVAIEQIDPPHGYIPAGMPELRRAVAARLTREEVPTAPEEVLITTGAQQALALIAAAYLRPGDAVAVEDPGFPNAFDTFRAAGAELLPVPVDDEGIDLDALEELCAARPPRFVYVTPTHQSPTGGVLGSGRRRRLARIAERFRIPVAEDSALADIQLSGAPSPPHVARFSPDAPILLVGSMSKLFWGGLRVGWIRAGRPTIRKLVRLKLMADIATPLVSQLLATPLIEKTEEARSLRRAQYLPRLDRLATALEEHLPDWNWSRPDGGFTLWAQLPGADASAYASRALRHGVSIAPGPRLSTEDRHRDCVRIAFMLDADVLEEGVERLARAWMEYRGEGGPSIETESERVFV